MSECFDDFKNALAASESGGQPDDGYGAQNQRNFLGKWQFGERALADLGYVSRDSDLDDNDYSGGWTGKDGVNSLNDFLSSHTAQDNAIEAYLEKQWGYIRNLKLDDFLGETINGTLVTESGLLAGAHLGGVGGLRDYLRSGGTVNYDDGETAIGDYLDEFGGFCAPFNDPPPVPPRKPPVPDWALDAEEPFATAPIPPSPLVIDIDGDGIELTTFDSIATTTFFDIDNDGFAEQTAWVDVDDALLARDVNENGTIDSSAELFGGTSTDGFAVLTQLDSNGDLIIDQFDDAWDELLVWQDANGDAVSQSGELITLNTAGIKNIRLDLVAPSASTISGNLISHTSVITWANNDTDAIVDAWFAGSELNTVFVGEYTFDEDTHSLPTLRGFGQLADLHIAMSINEDLFEVVEDFATNFSVSDFSDDGLLNEAINEILYTWAGVEEVDPNSRGIYMDAQKLGFLEKFFGEEYEAIGSYPFPTAAVRLDTAWRILFDGVKAQLLMQTDAQVLFNGTTYDPLAGEIAGLHELNENAIAALANDAPAPGAANEAYWLAITKFIDTVKGIDNLTVDEEEWLDDAIYDSDPTLAWTDIVDLYEAEPIVTTLTGTSGPDTLNGTDAYEIIYALPGNDTVNAGGGYDTVYGHNGNDEIHGGNGNDTIYGDNDNDTLFGDAGIDLLFGDAGNDVLSGGAGGNSLSGGGGDDVFIYTEGEDWITDASGTDEIQLPSGITSGDLTFYRTSTSGSTIFFNDLIILIDGGGSIQIENHFGGNSQDVETLRFSNNSTINLVTFTAYETLLSAGDDSYSPGLSSNDVVFGATGSDYIATYDGNDTLDGGDGNDMLSGGEGNDIYFASAGFDYITDNGDGTDTIVLPDTVVAGDVTYLRTQNISTGEFDDLKITVAGLGQIFVQLQYYAYSTANVVESLYFESNSSTVNLTTVTAEARGGSGDDIIYNITGTVNEVFNGMEGNDSMFGGAGNDRYWFSVGVDQIYESSGSDTIEVRPDFIPAEITIVRSIAAGLDDLLITDNEGNSLEVLSHFSNSDQSIEHVHFQGGTTWNIASMEISTVGTSGAETLYGADIGDASTADTIYGYGGNDQLFGYEGNDTLYGGADDDYAYGGDDSDTLYGDAGSDNLFGYAGTDTLHGGDDSDTLHGGSNTSDGDDSSADVLYGNGGNDTLYGNAGDDTLSGGAGTDTLRGGDDADTFVFEAASAFSNVDSIDDFSAGNSDKIDLHDVLDLEFDPLTEAISDFVNFVNAGSNSTMQIDRDGTGSTYTWANVATLNGVINLDETTLYTNGNLLAA